MRIRPYYILFILLLLHGCDLRKDVTTTQPQLDATEPSDTTWSDVVDLQTLFLPDTCFESTSLMKFEIEHADSGDYTMKDLQDRYEESPHIMTFRKNLSRNADFDGKVNGTPDSISIAWTFTTENDTTLTAYGRWGGGTGWTGQPLYMKWSKEEMQRFKYNSSALTAHFTNEEIFIASLCGKGYFINFQNGELSRQVVELGQVIKGTPSIDPEYHILYVGHGVPAKPFLFGCLAFDMLQHKPIYTIGRDPKAWRGWGAFDSSPIVAGGFLFWPAENGTLYKFERWESGLRKVGALRYKVHGVAPGIESSICIYKNYGYFSDNHGNIIAVNLNTLKPVWLYSNHDDSDATIVCKEEDGIPYLYTASEVERQGDEGWCYMVKINGLDGSLVWENKIHCNRAMLPNKVLDGGMYASLLLGKGDCEGLLFAHICRNEKNGPKGELVAIDTHSGRVVYSIPYALFAWSSPIGLYNEQNEMFVFACDATGTVRVLRGKTGEVLCSKRIGHNFESSPIAIGNAVVIGSRNRKIYKFVIE